MRLDKFLKVTQVLKRRSVAKESAEEGVIKIDGKAAKPSHEVKAGNIIEIDMWNYYKSVRVLAVPGSGSVPKAKLDEYIELIDYKTK